MVVALEFNEPSSPYMTRYIPAGLDAHRPVQTPVQHQRGHRNQGQEGSHIRVAQCIEHSLESPWARGRAEQPGPPCPRQRITGKTGAEGLDPDGTTPSSDQAFPPGVELVGAQCEGMIGRPASFGQYPEQNEAGYAAWMLGRELDARPATLRC